MKKKDKRKLKIGRLKSNNIFYLLLCAIGVMEGEKDI